MSGARVCKVLNVAEKNDAAKELSNVMSRGRFNRVRWQSKLARLPIIWGQPTLVANAIMGNSLFDDPIRVHVQP